MSHEYEHDLILPGEGHTGKIGFAIAREKQHGVWCACNGLGLRLFQEVTLYKDGGPLGLSIIGGSDHFCVPFGTSPDDPGIYISKVSRSW